MVKICVAPAWMTCPGATSLSTASPAMGASTGISGKVVSIAMLVRMLDAHGHKAWSAAWRSACGLALASIPPARGRPGDDMVLIESSARA